MVNEKNDALTYTYRALYPIVWFSILIFSLGQVSFSKIIYISKIYSFCLIKLLGSTSNI